MQYCNVVGVVVDTAPAETPVTLAEAKLRLRIDGSTEDSYITMLIEAATSMAEEYMHRKIVTQTLKASFDWLPISGMEYRPIGQASSLGHNTGGKNDFYLPYPPLQSISSFVLYRLDNTSATYAASNYTADTSNGRVLMDYGYSSLGELRRSNAIEITYIAGFGLAAAVPSTIKIGILDQVKKMYDCGGVCDMCEGMSNALDPYRLFDQLGF